MPFIANPNWRMTNAPAGRPNIYDAGAAIIVEAQQTVEQGYADGARVTSVIGRGSLTTAERTVARGRTGWQYPLVRATGGPVGQAVLEFTGIEFIGGSLSYVFNAPACIAVVCKTTGTYEASTLARIHGGENGAYNGIYPVLSNGGPRIRATAVSDNSRHESGILANPDDWMVIVHALGAAGQPSHLVVTGSDPVSTVIGSATTATPVRKLQLGSNDSVGGVTTAVGWKGLLAEVRQEPVGYDLAGAIELHARLSRKHGVPV